MYRFITDINFQFSKVKIEKKFLLKKGIWSHNFKMLNKKLWVKKQKMKFMKTIFYVS
jgi:hypothetical protein